MTSRQTDPDLRLAQSEHRDGGRGQVGNVHFVNVWMEDFVDKTDRGRLVRVLVWQLDVDLPHAVVERGCGRARLSASAKSIQTHINPRHILSLGP